MGSRIFEAVVTATIIVLITRLIDEVLRDKDDDKKKTEGTEAEPVTKKRKGYVGLCRSCSELVLWVFMVRKDGTVAKKPSPVNISFRDGGNIKLRHGRTSERLYGKVVDVTSKSRKHKSHFATCPDSAQWRKRGKESPGKTR